MVKRERDLSVSPMALQDPLGTVHPEVKRARKRVRLVRYLSQGHALDSSLTSP